MGADTTDLIVAKIGQYLDKLKDVEVAWLYGSRARGDNHRASDYDLAVAFKGFPQSPTERRLRPELLALDLQAHLNFPEDALTVVDINLASIPLAFNIIEHQEIVLEKNKLRRLQEEQRIMSRYEIDFAWHLKHHG